MILLFILISQLEKLKLCLRLLLLIASGFNNANHAFPKPNHSSLTLFATNPKHTEILLDENGYTNVYERISKLNAHNENISFEIRQDIADTNNKKRFAFNDDLIKIRASQGHSVDIELGYTQQQPPAILYHGTVEKFLASIMKNDLQKMQRHHVHLSACI